MDPKEKFGIPPMVQSKIIDPQKVWHRKQFLAKGKDLITAYHDGVISAQLFIDEIVDCAMKLAMSLDREKDVEFITTFVDDQNTMETASNSDNDYDIIDLDDS